jgi:hypothetical protein
MIDLQIGGQRRDPDSNAGRLAFGTRSPLFSPLNMHGKSNHGGRVLAAVLALCLTFACAAFAQSGSHTIRLTGWVNCSMCIQANACKAKTRMSCVSWWVNQGSSYVLVVGTRNYRLLGADDELKGLASRTVTITGEQFRSDVTVSSIEPLADGAKAKDQR